MIDHCQQPISLWVDAPFEGIHNTFFDTFSKEFICQKKFIWHYCGVCINTVYPWHLGSGFVLTQSGRIIAADIFEYYFKREIIFILISEIVSRGSR